MSKRSTAIITHQSVDKLSLLLYEKYRVLYGVYTDCESGKLCQLYFFEYILYNRIEYLS